MQKEEVERYKFQFECHPDRWKMYGIDLVDAGSPNPATGLAWHEKP